MRFRLLPLVVALTIAIGAAPSAGAGNAELAQQEKANGLRLPYTDLARCLAEVQAVLDGANLAYSVHPVGGGQFLVETNVPEPEARVLIARLTGALGTKGQEKREQGEPGRLRELERAPAPQESKAKDVPLRTVHLVLRFYRAAEADAAPAALPAEPAPQK